MSTGSEHPKAEHSPPTPGDNGVDALCRAVGAQAAGDVDQRLRMFETLLSRTADFVYLFDPRGRFLYVNQALLDLWGKRLDEAIGRDFFDLEYPDELAARLQRQIQEVIDTGKPLRDETPYTSQAGTRSYEYIFMPVFAADGSVEAVAGSTRDITERTEAERRLRASEMRYRALVDASSDVVYRMSADWSEMHPLDGRDLVASNEEPIRDWLERNIPAFEHGRVKRAIAEAIAGRRVFELEHQVVREDGSLGWTASRAAPILDEAGEIIEWFGTARDITDRKRIESELGDIRSRMEAALNAGAIGTWNWDVVADRFYGDVSLAHIFDVPPEAVAGGTLATMVDAIHPEDRARVEATVRGVLASGDQYQSEYRVRRPDGSWRWVEARGQIERDGDGRPVRFPGVVIDITDQKVAEGNLAIVRAESDRRTRLYETILSNTPDLVYVFDLDHRFVYANEVLLRMWGKSWDEAIGKTCLELGYEPWHASMHDREIEEVIATKRPIRGEVPFEGTFGRRIYDYIFVPIIGDDGEVEGIAGTTRDVTERKESEEALRDADRKKDDFIALLAHELRNPLAPIRNGLQTMRLAADNPAAVARARGMMERQLTHMVRLIDDLLDVSRVTRNKLELRRARVGLADVMNHAVEAASPVIEAAGHELVIDLPGEPVTLDADLTRLAQVFSNLLTNSAKYTPQRGRIEVSAVLEGGDVVVSVRDNGMGIPAPSLPTIFDMFSQVNHTGERTGGLGIGLALVKGLVEMHGGTVEAESVEGEGSVFRVRLPVAEKGGETAAAALRVEQASHARRVLVVDDNRDSAESMAELLRVLGCEVAVAYDGHEAVAATARFRPQIILIDVGLPGQDGLAATRQIRGLPGGAAITIVAMTGWGQESDREQSREAGCDLHLVKPVEFDALERVLAAE